MDGRGVPDQELGDALDVVKIDHRNARRRQRFVRCNGDDGRIIGVHERLAHAGPMHLQLGMRLALIALHQHEIDRAELVEQRFEGELGVSTQLVHERPTVGRADQHLARPRHPVGMGVLARLVDVEGVMGMLEGRYLEPAGDDTWDYLGEERGLARAAPAGEADDAHAGIISGVADVKASPPPERGDYGPIAACRMRAPGYSAACIRPSGGAAVTCPLAISRSAHTLWCSFAQLTSTVPSHIASKAPSIPMVPI